jgi:hypothetical protein
MTKRSQEIFVLGLFFLLWATGGYVLFGNLGKYISLTLGVFLILYSVVPNSIDLKAMKLIIASFFFIIIYFKLVIECYQNIS